MILSYTKLRKQAEEILSDNSSDKTTAEMNNLIKELMLYQIELELQNEQLVKIQSELEYSRDSYAELYENAPVGYFNLDQNGLILKVNQAGSQLLQIKNELLVQRSFSRYILPQHQKTFLDHRIEALRSKDRVSCEVQLLDKNAVMRDVQIDSVAVYNPITAENEFLTFVMDISARKLADEYLRGQQTQLFSEDRANTISEFAARITNELNEPLGIVGNYLSGCILRLEKSVGEDKSLLWALKKATEALDRSYQILHDIKNIKSRKTLCKEKIDFDLFMEETLKLINYEIKDYPVKIYCEKKGNFTALFVDKAQIQQVILNLTRNAFEAMKDAKTIQPRIFIEARMLLDNIMEMKVTDNGPGITKEMESRLFNSHFSNKPYGLGLGLIASKGIVEAHGGKLGLEEFRGNQGACFVFTLPISN